VTTTCGHLFVVGKFQVAEVGLVYPKVVAFAEVGKKYVFN
jgi:hypothetical protein